MERCQSGRMDRTRNAAYPYGYPGFESQSLRYEGNRMRLPSCFRERILTQGFFASLKRQSRTESQSLRTEGNRMRLPSCFRERILTQGFFAPLKRQSRNESQSLRYEGNRMRLPSFSFNCCPVNSTFGSAFCVTQKLSTDSTDSKH